MFVTADKDGVEKRLMNLQSLGYISAKYYTWTPPVVTKAWWHQR